MYSPTNTVFCRCWRTVKCETTSGGFAAGLQFDVFNPLAPTILPFSALSASGNSGNAFRGQVRLERVFTPSNDVQWTLQGALSEPIPTTIDPTFRISEDNGWPNVECRIALGLGCPRGAGAAGTRPFELGFSGIVGQIRTTLVPPDPQVATDVWGIGTDLRWRVNELFGFAAEFYSGQGLGTYNGAILQTVNSDTTGSDQIDRRFLRGLRVLDTLPPQPFGLRDRRSTGSRHFHRPLVAGPCRAMRPTSRICFGT